MLCCDTGSGEVQSFDELAVLVSQLTARGHDARVHVRAVPEGLGRNAQFDIVPHLFDHALRKDDRLLLSAAQRLDDAKLAQLRRLAGRTPLTCIAFGSFGSRQSVIGTRARLSYALGRDPEVHDLSAGTPRVLGTPRDCPVFGVARETPLAAIPRVLLVAPVLREAPQAAALRALALSRRLGTTVLTDGKTKQAWVAAQGSDIAFYHYGEALPTSLAERAEICVICAPLEQSYRLQCLVANLAVSGAALIDATPTHALARASDAFVRGPVDLVGLGDFLEREIVPNLRPIAEQTRASATAAHFAPPQALEPAPIRRARPAEADPARVVFMPTNGVGLGHAQRCALIARALAPASAAPVFAVFPSCTGLVKSFGFDAMPLIGRSAFHAQTHANDLANHLRLRALTQGARALVFDGGYVFDSVCRAILENRLRGIWIRRGLWQPGQNNAAALDREKVFDRVIVPREAFDEINAPYSHGRHLREVGPVVQRVDTDPARRRALRDRLAERLGIGFERLVVSLLGAGVAADRSPQIQALCGLMERRPHTLHLIVVWPTAIQQPAWFAWSRSRVVRTRHAAALAAAADLCIGAAGYNSFHESLYNRIPTILIPQMGSFMDDQRARARAARERDLAGLVEPHELMALEREIARFLDGGEAEAVRQRLAALDLPEPGNAAAARLIEEVMHGCAALGDDPVANRATGRH